MRLAPVAQNFGLCSRHPKLDIVIQYLAFERRKERILQGSSSPLLAMYSTVRRLRRISDRRRWLSPCAWCFVHRPSGKFSSLKIPNPLFGSPSLELGSLKGPNPIGRCSQPNGCKAYNPCPPRCLPRYLATVPNINLHKLITCVPESRPYWFRFCPLEFPLVD